VAEVTESASYPVPVRTRLVRTTDTDAVADVYVSALAGMTYLPDRYTESENRAFVADVLLPNNEVWVAETAGDVAGFVGFGDGSVRHLWVGSRAQGQGIGTVLLRLAMDRNPTGLRLSVFQRNDGARRLYERHGFRLAELRDGSHNGDDEPEALYVWEHQHAT
jgi:putative acetyltransferase